MFMSIRPIPVQTKVHFKILQLFMSCNTRGLEGSELSAVFKLFLETEMTRVYQSMIEIAYSRVRTYVLRFVKG